MVTPINDPPNPITVVGELRNQPPPPRRFPWPLLLALIGAASVFGVVTSGAFDRTSPGTDTAATTIVEDLVAGTEPEPTTTTTTTTLPPTLAEQAPALRTGSLRIAVTEGFDTLSVKLWNLDEREPSSIEIAGGADGAQFNSSGSWIGIAADDQVRLVGLDSPGFATLSDLSSVAWHESDPNLIAGTIEDETKQSLAVWHVDEGLVRQIGAIESYGGAGIPPRLAAWGDWGFAIQEPLSVDPVVFLTTIVNPDGAVIAQAPAGVATTNAGTLAIVSFSEVAAETGVELPVGTLDLPPGVIITDRSLTPVSPQPQFPDFEFIERIVLSPDGVWIAVAFRVSNDAGGAFSRVEISRLSGVGATTIIPFDGDIVLGGFTDGSDHLLVHEPLPSPAVVQIVNHRTGATWAIPLMGDRVRIIDVTDGS